MPAPCAIRNQISIYAPKLRRKEGPFGPAAIRLQTRVSAVDPEPQASLEGYFEVNSARVAERAGGLWATLEIKSRQEQAAGRAGFYAEYFDNRGKRCFTLLFSASHNLQGLHGPFKQGETRTLVSSTALLAPATKPTKVKVYRLSVPEKGRTYSPGAEAVQVLSPIRLESAGEMGQPWNKVWLGPDIEKGEWGMKPVVDLVLARVSVGGDGKLENVEILNSADSALAEWFRTFVSHQHFSSAEVSGVPVPGASLVLVQAFLSLKLLEHRAYLPRDSDWVREYVAGLTGPKVPVINVVLLEPASANYYKNPSPGYFTYDAVDSAWSLGISAGGSAQTF